MQLPLNNISFIPTGNHPGAFGVKRKYDNHTGIDLYCKEGDPVYAMEDGYVCGFGYFTGSEVDTPWWNTTYFVSIKGSSGIFCYGEILIKKGISIDQKIKEGELIGYVIPVLPEAKIREDIPYHSNNMLHIELYSKFPNYDKDEDLPVDWKHDMPKPNILLDPTKILLDLSYAKGNIQKN